MPCTVLLNGIITTTHLVKIISTNVYTLCCFPLWMENKRHLNIDDNILYIVCKHCFYCILFYSFWHLISSGDVPQGNDHYRRASISLYPHTPSLLVHFEKLYLVFHSFLSVPHTVPYFPSIWLYFLFYFPINKFIKLLRFFLTLVNYILFTCVFT